MIVAQVRVLTRPGAASAAGRAGYLSTIYGRLLLIKIGAMCVLIGPRT